MEQTAEQFKVNVLTEEEQNEAYWKAQRELDARQSAWKKAQESFLDANPLFRDDPDLNATFVSEVNRLLVTEAINFLIHQGMTLTDLEILEAAKELAVNNLAMRPFIKNQLN